MTITTTEPSDLETAVGALAERLFMGAVASFELATIELGMRLGLYGALAEGQLTPPELAKATGIDGRYAREWLEQQATAGFVAVDADPLDGDPDARIFSLPEAIGAILLDPESLAHLAPLATFAVAASEALPALEEAYRNGTGISFGGYGDWVRKAQEGFNRPAFTHLLASEWLPTMPDVVARLQAPGAKVADIGCGCGWSSIALARAFPGITVVGVDTDEASVADATANAAAAGVGDRVRFQITPAEGDGYTLVCCFEALHDMAHPVEVLAAMRSLAAPDGAVLVMDERAADALTANDPDPVQRLLYSASVLHCLPVGMSEEHSAGTGTVMRTATFERYADGAGFDAVEVLPIEHDMFRFYRLR